MLPKRSLSQKANWSPNKRKKSVDRNNSLYKTMEESGLTLKHPPEKCRTIYETIHIVRNIKRNLQKHFEYPRNVLDIYNSLKLECEDLDIFKHYLFPNITRSTEDYVDERPISDSVLKILLSVPVLQEKLIDYIFEKAIDLAVQSQCGPWIQMILKSFSTLDCIVSSDKISSHLINLLDTSTEKMVRLEIITAIPDIIGDQEHNSIASEMSRILSEDHDLIPAILECLSYLCLSDEQYELLQKKTLTILTTLSKYNYFSNFVKFLLIPGRTSDNAYLEAVRGLRNALGWPISKTIHQEIATSQVLTATAIRNSMISSKVISNAWLKLIYNCKNNSDYKSIDFIILLILYSTSDEKQRQVENIIKKQIKSDILRESVLNEVFEKHKPILREFLKTLINLTNSLLKATNEILVETFAKKMYTLMFSYLKDCCQTIVAELLQLGLDRKQCVLNILTILNCVASRDLSVLKPQSLQMLTLLDRMDDMTLIETRSVMNLLCGLAYSYENSVIRDDIHMIIRKELSSSNPTIKMQGIFAGVHAVKYLMASNSNEDNSIDLPDNVSYGSISHLAEGDLREAAQIIELISRSTKQFPDLTVFFYDELSNIISSSPNINKHFMAWLTDAVTNDLQQNFIIDTINVKIVNKLQLSMQYCLNAESEMDEVIAINIAGLTLQSNVEINIGILSPLFQLVQILHSKQHCGNLSSIDALLGCPVVIPDFDIELVEDMDSESICNILDCLIHCVNWFRELLNAFATQNDDTLKIKILQRVQQVDDIETMIDRILIQTKILYKPPICTFNVTKYWGEKKVTKIQHSKQKLKKPLPAQDDTILPDTIKSQSTQTNYLSVKDKVKSLPLRTISVNLIHVLKNDLSLDNESENHLNIGTLNFLLKCINGNLENILISKIKHRTFLFKQDDLYDPIKAEDCAKTVSEILPKIVDHMKFVTSYIESNLSDSDMEDGVLYTAEMIKFLTSLEYIYDLCRLFFKWIGFKNQHSALLKNSLKLFTNINDGNATTLKELVMIVVKHIQTHEKYCLQLSTAVSLIEFIKAVQDYHKSTTTLKVLRDLAQIFLSKKWRSVDGALEKGVFFNQHIDKLAGIYLVNNEIIALKNLTLQLSLDIKDLKNKNDSLNTLKCINKNNFPILFRNLGTALCEATKSHLNKGLTNSEHLQLWKDVATILKYMTDIAKSLESRNNLSAIFKKSLPILKLFISQGIPIFEIQLKNDTNEILEILKILQQSTRFLQSLCCHSRLKKDTVLMNKVPYMRQLLETLIYKIKAALVANNCSEAFWMGNLKNKNIHGEVIATQQSIESEESVEDCDEQLPDDNDETDEEMIDPDSKSISDIV